MDKVLVVDGDPERLEALSEGLRKYKGQFEVLTVSDGESALNVFKSERISVLVTHPGMPGKEGQALLALMKKKYPQVPCVVMAEPAGPEKKEAENVLLEARFNTIATPFDVNELADLILQGLYCLDEGEFWQGQRR